MFGEKGRFGAGVSNRPPRMEKAKLSTEGQAQEARTPSCNHRHLSAPSHPLMLLWSPGENTTKGPSEAALFSSPPRHTASPNPRQRKLCELKVCRCKGNGGPGWIERPGDAKKEKKKAKKKKKAGCSSGEKPWPTLSRVDGESEVKALSGRPHSQFGTASLSLIHI